MGELKWYVVRAVSGQEKKVKDYLLKELENQKLEKFITEVIVPTEKVYQARKQRDGKVKKIAVEKNLLPGYVIVQADLTNGEVQHTINSVPGVIGFLNADTKDPTVLPKPMRESEINQILGKVDESDEGEVKHDTSYSVGETVRVMDGPFSGFSGSVEEVFEEKKKLNVMVKIFGRNAPVELDYKQVEKEE
ncbi:MULTISPECIES: transcription termination/antitermination protein NusG [Flammeovirga]|uniref:Transcription termination/antitermination protein NusG n=1 Tax=Flammeovirga agarivorans TaxID=2726742 RepID=A0A7X8XXL1_9BACT|nr:MULTISPECIES: transcription termination/antitermination protein NusG [Flammeovirga]NLR93273.1 transcription termination/antitermination factor NusG [Flammeovirga agarivorans]